MSESRPARVQTSVAGGAGRATSPAATGTARVPWTVAGLAALGAAAVNVAVYVVGESVSGGLRAPMGQSGELTDLPVVAVVLVSVLGTMAAAVALRVVQRVLPLRARTVWLGLVAVGLVLSLAPMPRVPAESVPWLVAMHVVVALVAVAVLGRRAQRS
ncbi:MAG TPA: DUF6069 family protein [Jiangellales bacterium]|nr:DUF6069 family protein [Jiangellales bacterium]